MFEKLEKAIANYLVDKENTIYSNEAISAAACALENEKLQGFIDYKMHVINDPDMSGGTVVAAWVENNELESYCFEFRG